MLCTFLFAGDIMEQTDGNEESSPKPDDGNATGESALPDTGDMKSSSNPQVETAQEESLSNESGLQSASPKPNVAGLEGEPSLANEDAENLSGTGSEQNSADSAQMNVAENGIVCKMFSRHTSVYYKACFHCRIDRLYLYDISNTVITFFRGFIIV